jgi:ABC-2 type transport system ATP-binding protein
MATLVEAVAEHPLTVVLSSHLLPDLERICDHLVVLSGGRLVLAADIDDVLATHRVVTATERDAAVLSRDHDVVTMTRRPRQVCGLVRLRGPVVDPSWDVAEVSLEEIVLGYLGAGRPAGPQAADAPLALVEDGR